MKTNKAIMQEVKCDYFAYGCLLGVLGMGAYYALLSYLWS